MSSFYKKSIESISKQRLLNNLTILLTMIICGGAQLSCASKSYFEGEVSDTQNNPIEGVEVKLVAYKETQANVSVGLVKTTETDKDGKFRLFVKKFNKEMKLGIIPIKGGYRSKPIGFTPTEFQKHNEAFKDYKIILKKQNE